MQRALYRVRKRDVGKEPLELFETIRKGVVGALKNCNGKREFGQKNEIKLIQVVKAW